MSRRILGLCLLLLAQPMAAQEWCTPDATWRSWSAGFGWEIHREIQCAGDTTINGLPAHRLNTREEGFFDSQPIGSSGIGYVAASDDVLWYVKTVSPFELDTLGWFAAQPGDSWTFEVPDFPALNVHVTATGSGLRDFGPVQLRYVTVDYTGMFGPVNDTIFERIGPLAIDPLAPTIAFGMESGYAGLVCYHDMEITWLIPQQPELLDCFSPLSTNSGSPVGSSPALRLHPNPSDGPVFAQPDGRDHSATIVVFDPLGRAVVRTTRSALERGLDLSHLADGGYRFLLTGSEGHPSSTTWLKH